VYVKGNSYRVTLSEQCSFAFNVEDYVEPRLTPDDDDEER